MAGHRIRLVTTKTMKARLYIKPNTVGLQFENAHSRDLFLLSLKHKQVDACAESFGEKSVRLNSSKATKTLDFMVDVGLHANGVVKVFVQEEAKAEKPKQIPVTVTPAAPEKTVKAADIRPQAPVNPIGTLPPEVTGETAIAVQTQPEVVQAPPAPAMLKVPEIRGITVDEPSAPKELVDDDPKPVGVHHLSKEMRDWKKRQEAKAAA